MHKALYPRDDVDRLYVSIKKGRRGLASFEDSVDASIQQLKDYTEKHEGGLITASRKGTNNTIYDRMTITRKQKWGKKLNAPLVYIYIYIYIRGAFNFYDVRFK